MLAGRQFIAYLLARVVVALPLQVEVQLHGILETFFSFLSDVVVDLACFTKFVNNLLGQHVLAPAHCFVFFTKQMLEILPQCNAVQ